VHACDETRCGCNLLHFAAAGVLCVVCGICGVLRFAAAAVYGVGGVVSLV